MVDRGPLRTPFDDAQCPTPGGEPSGGAAMQGGFDLGPGSQKETPNSVSGLPTAVTTFDVGPGSEASQVAEPPVASPGVSHPGKP